MPPCLHHQSKVVSSPGIRQTLARVCVCVCVFALVADGASDDDSPTNGVNISSEKDTSSSFALPSFFVRHTGVSVHNKT